ncbi:MAG: amidohydrolase [Dinoroseobacter sp.]|nr:amidohydrolase [Dinoroseobacter sp.]
MSEEHPCKVLRGGLLLDIPGRKAEPADILIEGAEIREIGRPGMEVPDGAQVINATDRLIMPGLVNAHTHGHGSLGKGLGDKWSLELLLNAAPWTSSGFSLEDKLNAAQLNAAEMVLKGCTAAYDMYFEFPSASADGISAIGQGYRDLGVRVVLAPMMADITLFHAIPGLLDALPEPLRSRASAMKATPHETHIANCREILESWAFDRDEVRPALGPTIPLHCTDAFLTACRALSDEFGVEVQMHLAESRVQAAAAQPRYGKSLAAHLDTFGLLSERFTGAHGVWLDDADLDLVAKRGAKIAHNPGSNLRLGSGIAPARKMLERGITVGIGTDGSGSSDNQNMFEAMRMASFVSRTKHTDPAHWLGTWEVLEMATSGSAAVLGMGDRIGTLAPGYKADMVFLDLTSVNFTPLNDAANQVVNCEDSSAVSSVMIGGRMVLSDRKFLAFDFDDLRARVQVSVERIAREAREKREVSELMARFVSSHCIGLACRHE